jgi:predicted negative regulator of RcsB-dependent stress response
MGEPFTLPIVLSFLATLYCLADMVPETLEISEALVDITSAHGISFYARLGAVNRAWAAGRLGDPQESARAVRSAIALRIENGEGFFETFALAQLAQLQILAKDFEGALATLDEASASVDRTGEVVGQARLQTLRGDCLLSRDVIAAEEAYLRALSGARAQGARTFGLQAAIPLISRGPPTSPRAAPPCAGLFLHPASGRPFVSKRGNKGEPCRVNSPRAPSTGPANPKKE